MIKNLIFDLGNVIVDLDLIASERLLQQLTGISWLNARAQDLEIFLDFECGRIPEALFLNYLIGQSKNGVQAIDLIKAWNAMLIDIPLQRLLMLKRLMKDYQVFLLSNTNETHIRWVDQYLKVNYKINNLTEVVHAAFYSHELLCRKPEKEIYQQVLDRANIKAEESVFFDDNHENIAAAQEMGIISVKVDPADEITTIVPSILEELHAKTS